MALKNRSMYAILGILSISPQTGYDIKKYSDTVLASFWNENFGHIYPTLKKMADDGLIEVVNSSGNDRRIVYGITESGRMEFRTWLTEDTVPQPLRSEFMLKLLFSGSSPKSEIIGALEKQKERQKKRLEAYLNMQESLMKETNNVSKDRAVFLYVVLRSGILAAETSIKWCDETMKYIDDNKD